MNQYSSSAMRDATKAPTLRDRLRETTSTAILEAAEQVAAQEGSANASLSAIAEKAGVAVGTIYNYFKDRDELFNALFAKRRTEYYEAIDVATRAHAREPFEQQLRGFLSGVFEYFDSHRAFLRICFEADNQARFHAKQGDAKPAAQQLHERAERIVKVGLKEKRLKEESSDAYAIVLSSIVRGYLMARQDDPRSYAGEVDRVMDIFLHGASR